MSNDLAFRLAAMASVAEGEQPVDISSWVDALKLASEIIGTLDSSRYYPSLDDEGKYR